MSNATCDQSQKNGWYWIGFIFEHGPTGSFQGKKLRLLKAERLAPKSSEPFQTFTRGSNPVQICDTIRPC